VTEELREGRLLKPDEIEYKGKKVPRMPTCTLTVVDGHIEAECETKKAQHELAELLEHEVIIRVKPAKVTEELERTGGDLAVSG